MAIWGAAKLAKGTVQFSKWSAEMVSELGEQVRPQLQALYEKAKTIYQRNIAAAENGFPNAKKLMQMYHAGEDGAGWYAATRAELEKTFGPDTNTFVDMLAATSPNTTVKANFTLALKAYQQWKLGQEFTGYLPETINSLKKIANGEDFGGLKVQSFRANLHGAPDPVTIDRWMSRAFGYGDKSITDPRYKFMDATVTQLAKSKGFEPRAVQAAIWKAIKDAEQTGEAKFGGTFESLLEDNLHKNPQLRALLPKQAPGT